MHMSDSGSERARTKFKEGQKVTGRVLEVDPAARRITLSLKKLLVGEKLPPFASWQVSWHHYLIQSIIQNSKLKKKSGHAVC